MRKFVAFVGLLGVIYALAVQHGVFDRAAAVAAATTVVSERAAPSTAEAVARSAGNCDNEALVRAYRTHASHIELCGRGVIARVLKDDTQGSRHQKFLVRLPDGQTVLIAYNYDLAPRIEGLKPAGLVEFEGEYEWNPQGGIVHWTHRDPSRRHPPGWILYGGRQYQ
jgi:hypothetical protein